MSEEKFEYKFIGNIILKGKIVCKTALHIGGSKDAYEIGGMDNPVIKTIRGEPYIPGSSLKGKMRSLLEWSLDEKDKPGPDEQKEEADKNNGKTRFGCRCGSPTCPICRIFGTPAETKRGFGPTRLVVRDAFMESTSKEKLQELGRTTELKMENTIDRISGKAEHPRPIERVPEGTVFAFSMVYSLYSVGNEDYQKDLEMFPHVLDAMALLEDSYLGGMGSRGSGQVEFRNIKVVFRSKGYYLKGELEKPVLKIRYEKLKEDKKKECPEFTELRITEQEKRQILIELAEAISDENPGSQS